MAIRSKGPSVSKRPMKTGTTRWLTNAMKSIGKAADTNLQEIAPNLHEVASSGIEVSRNFSKSLRGNKQGVTQINNTLNQNKYVRLLQTAAKNTVKDIKSGNFVHTDALLDELEDDEWGGGMTFGDVDGGTNIINVGDQGATIKAVDGISKQLTVNAAAQIKMQKASMDAYIATSAAGMQQVGEIGAEIVNQLTNVNSNLAALVQYNTDNMTKFIDASIAYYEKTGSKGSSDSDNKKLTGSDVLRGASGGINISNYKQYVKQQIKETADSSTAGIVLNLLDDDMMMKQLASNPLGFLTTGVVKYAMPKVFTTSIKAMEASFNNLMPNLLSEIADWANAEGTGFASNVKRTMGKIFGVKDERVKSIAKNAKVDYGPIPFDGETKHAITHIITKELSTQTGYLQIIAQHYNKDAKTIAEKGREYWDKRTNSYVTQEGLDKSIANEIIEAIRDGFSGTGFGHQMQHFVDSSGKDDKSRASMQRLVDELYTKISRSDKAVGLPEIMELIKNSGGSKEEHELISRFINDMAKNDHLAMGSVNAGRIHSRNKSNEVKNNIANNALDYHLFESIYGNKHIDSDDITDRVLAFGNYDALGQGLSAKERKRLQNQYKRDRKRWGNRATSGRGRLNGDVGLDEDAASYQLSNFDGIDLKGIAGSVGGVVNKILHGATVDVVMADMASGAKAAAKSFIDKHSDVFDEVKNNFKEIGQNIKVGLRTKFFGDPDKPDDKGGIFGIITNTITSGAKGWVDAFFGTEKSREDEKEEIYKSFLENAKEALPDTITGALIGGGIGALSGTSLLGFMIGGPFGGAILGAAGGFLARNEKFQDYIFGPKDEEGNRLGGLISKQTQDWAKEHKNSLIGGASFGAITGTLTGGGLLGTLVGGPIAGALMGMATTTILKSDTFHRFVFGDEENGQKGFLQGIKDAFTKHFKPKDDSETDIAKGIGMSILGAGAGGVLGAVFGGPILGAVAGLGLAIKAQSGNFKEWLFGKEEEGPNGEKRKKQGVVGQIGNILNANLIMPLKTNMEFLAKDAILTVEDTILTPIKFGAEIVADKAGEIVSDISDKIHTTFVDLGDNVKGFLSETFAPLTDAVGTAINGITTFAYNSTKAIVTAPFKVVGKMIDFATSKVGVVVGTVIDGVRNFFGTIKDAALGTISLVGKMALNGIKGLLKPVTWTISSVVGLGGNALKGAGQWIGDKLGPSITTYGGGTFRDRWNAAKGITKEKRDALRKDRAQARRTNENAKWIAKYTKGQYSVDSDEAREYLKQVNYRAWKTKFGSGDNKSTDDLARERTEAREGGSIAGLSDKQIASTDPTKLNPISRLHQTVLKIAENLEIIKKNETNEKGALNTIAEEAEAGREAASLASGGATKAGSKEANMADCNQFFRLLGYPGYSIRNVKKLMKDNADAYKVYEECVKSHKWPTTSEALDYRIEMIQRKEAKGESGGYFDDLKTFANRQREKATNFIAGDNDNNNLLMRILRGSVGEAGRQGLKFGSKTGSRWMKFGKNAAIRWKGDLSAGYDDFQGGRATGGKMDNDGTYLVGENGAELIHKQGSKITAVNNLDSRMAAKRIEENAAKQKQAVEDAKTAKEQREEREKAEEKKADKEYKSTVVSRFKEVVGYQKTSAVNFLKTFGKTSLIGIGAGLIAKFLISNPGIVKGAIDVIKALGSGVSKLLDVLSPILEKIGDVASDIFGDLLDDAKRTEEEHARTNGRSATEQLKDNVTNITENKRFIRDSKGNWNHQSGARARLVAHGANIGVKKGDKLVKGVAKKVNKGKDIFNYVFKGGKSTVAKGGGEAVTDGAKSAIANIGGKTGGNFVDDAAKTVTKVASSAGDDAVKAGAELVQTGKKGMLKTVLGFFDDAMKFVYKSVDDLAKQFGKSKAGSTFVKFASKLVDDVIKVVTEKFPKIAAKVEAIVGGRSAGAAATGGISEGVFVIAGAVNGLTAAKKLFHVDEVDAKMIAISGIWGGLASSLPGSILDVINGLVFDVLGIDFISEIACKIYAFISPEEDEKKLEKARNDFFSKYGEYKEKSIKEQYDAQIAAGIIDSSVTYEEFKKSIENDEGKYKVSYKSFADYNDDEHASFLGKVGKKLVNAGKGIKKAFVGTEKYTDSKGNVYTKNKDGDFDVKDASGKKLGTVGKDAIPDDARKGETGGVVGAFKKGWRAEISLIAGKKTLVDSDGNKYVQNNDGSYTVTDANGNNMGTISSDQLPEEAKKTKRTGGFIGGLKSLSNKVGGAIKNGAKSVFGVSDTQLSNTDPSKLDPSSRSAYYLHAIFESLTGIKDTRNKNNGFTNTVSTLLKTNPITNVAMTSAQLMQKIRASKSKSGGSGEGSYFSQTDNRWANNYYGSDGATMKDSGCGPAAVAMAVNDARHKDYVDPTNMARLATATGDRDETGTNWNFVGKASSAMGLNSSQTINPNAYDLYNQAGSGNPVVLSGVSNGSGPYTKAGHYVVAEGLDSNGNIKVKDPRGRGYSRSYSPDTLAKHTGSAWMIKGGHGKNRSGVADTEKAKGLSAINRKAEAAAIGSSQATDYQKWIGIIKAVKKAIADKNMGYSQSAWTDITIGGKTLKVRTDCSGFVLSCMKFYGVLPENSSVGSTHGMGKDSSDMIKSGFTAKDWPGWDSLEEGDILVNTASHTEIFSHNEGGQHYVYNCGSNSSCNNPNATVTGHPNGYQLIWKPGPAGADCVEGVYDPNAHGSAGEDGTASVTSGETSLFSKIGAALSGSIEAMAGRIFSGDFSNTDYSSIVANAFSGGNSSSSSSGSTSADNLQGGTTAQKVWNYFTNAGYSKEATAGILGNLEQESGVDPKKIQGNGKGPAAGIAQWENYNTKSSRWKSLEDYAKSKGKDWTDLGSQLEFIDKELKGLGSFWSYESNMRKAGTTGTSYDKWKASTDIDTATRQFEGAFERAGIPMMDNRISAAKGYYNKFAGGSGYGRFGGFGRETFVTPGGQVGYRDTTNREIVNANMRAVANKKRAAELQAAKRRNSIAKSKELYGRSYNKYTDPTYGGRRTAESEMAKGLELIGNASSNGISGGDYSGSYSSASSGYGGGSSLSADTIMYIKKIVKLLDKIENHTGSSSKYLKNFKSELKNATNIIMPGNINGNSAGETINTIKEVVNKNDSSAYTTADAIARGNY